jgi:ABC-type sugar transport system substrate-binding protein
MSFIRFALLSLLALVAVALLAWAVSARPVAAAGEFDGVQCVTSANAVGFFDAQTGDVWFHATQADGSLRVTHMRASARGSKLVLVSDTK